MKGGVSKHCKQNSTHKGQKEKSQAKEEREPLKKKTAEGVNSSEGQG